MPRSNRSLVSGFFAVVLALSLAACGSNVKLDEAPVEDRGAGAGAGAAGTQGGAGSGVDPSGVSGVQVPGIDTQQPANMARVVYFDYDSFEVRQEFAGALEANAAFLKANPSRRVALEGHTDERGGREYNLALGQKRAEAVRRAMQLLGVSESQMEAVSFGEEKPAVYGFDESAFAQNRRVEITYR
ncbi:MAG: peptidoglycan-associated lipoprotein [Comamonadaceae bacterium]|nr:peptidoglycan-associated lipoprotein [Comamonadaceae bacterium]